MFAGGPQPGAEGGQERPWGWNRERAASM